MQERRLVIGRTRAPHGADWERDKQNYETRISFCQTRLEDLVREKRLLMDEVKSLEDKLLFAQPTMQMSTGGGKRRKNKRRSNKKRSTKRRSRK